MTKAPARRPAAFAALALLTLTCTLALADAPASQPSGKPAEAAAPGEPPAHVIVQHILIAFEGTLPGKNVTRTKEAARALAADVLGRARKGEDFDALVKEFTDDSAPGIYAMANHDVTPGPVKPGTRARGKEYARNTMVKSFGDVAFSLKIGEIGMADYDRTNSRFGWHIVKRLE